MNASVGRSIGVGLALVAAWALAGPGCAEVRAGGTRVSRPEERGEDFSRLSTGEVLERLVTTKDKIVQRKATQVLGDRELAGKLKLSRTQRAQLDAYVDKQMAATGSSASGERVEANHNIQRLWRLAADRLIANLGSKNVAVMEAAIKNLTKMRDGAIVEKIIRKAKTSKAPRTRHICAFALGMMNERSHVIVPRREPLDAKASEALARKHIIPFLKELQKRDKDPTMQRIVKDALRQLARPVDRRPRVVEPRRRGGGK